MGLDLVLNHLSPNVLKKANYVEPPYFCPRTVLVFLLAVCSVFSLIFHVIAPLLLEDPDHPALELWLGHLLVVFLGKLLSFLSFYILISKMGSNIHFIEFL